MVGSSNYDDTRMTFSNLKLYFDQAAANTIVDYKIEISGECRFPDYILIRQNNYDSFTHLISGVNLILYF